MGPEGDRGGDPRGARPWVNAGVGCSVHWRPLHLHPYYREAFGPAAEHLPAASREWPRRVSLPLFPGMRDEERDHVVAAERGLCRRFAARD